MAINQRPRFEVSHDYLSGSLLDDGWHALLSCPAGFSQDIFELGTTQLVHHPEYNSTLILRSEVISDMTFKDAEPAVDLPPLVPTFSGLRPVRCIHRKLLPRRPGRDAALEQYCTFYTSCSLSPNDDASAAGSPNTLVLTPIVEDGIPLPYYHPAVSHIAFRFLSLPPETGASPSPSSSETPSPQNILRIDAQPFPGVSLDPNDRLYRTSLALLETVYRYCWGVITQYKKRVVHDALVPRERYQDLYLIMRERHKGLVDTWKEVTDPLKHVFEDIGIATYLMLLWKDTFSLRTANDSPTEPETEDLTQEPWKK
ncbi:hypothetical protein D9619_011306 [Psilocybe cf. subviscida]|uniref:tRNA (uracil-O(2)-)-methyltransferase n=1 Tax=Psilocybe cf. subviscida TaxID=2480587 RepID=A0A8H5BIY2_9AGAR|nr:hypothetical protein D9619_011306 [Psilocybe cf. subviscida]